MSYAELAASTNFSFLRGASHPEELVAQADALGLAGLGVADRNSVAGVVRAHVCARETNARLRVIAGARLVFRDGTPDILAYPQDRAAWGRLCRLLTRGNMRARKGDCILFLDDLADWCEGLRLIVLEASSAEADLHPSTVPEPESGTQSGLASAPRPLDPGSLRVRGSGEVELHVSHIPGAGAAGTRDPERPGERFMAPGPRIACGVRGCGEMELHVSHIPGAGEAGTRDPERPGERFTALAPGSLRVRGCGEMEDNPSTFAARPGMWKDGVERLAALAPGRVWIGARMVYDGRMREALAERVALARRLGLPLIAVNDPIMHDPARRDLADALACIREGATIEEAGARRLHANAERHLKAPQEMARLFAEAPGAIAETLRFLDGVTFSLDDLRYEYPDELREGFATEQQALEHFAWEGAAQRYPAGVPEPVAQAIRYELSIVATLGYAAYFLTVHDIVRFARSRGILCQGRGSAANSSVCFCLGITEVDPTKHDLLFERFISAERREPPDIDVDFEHERREEVMQYIYARYGRERAGLTAAVITYRGRSALREMGKVFGFDDAVLGAMTATVWGSHEQAGDEAARRAGLDPADPRLAHVMRLAQEIAGFPRHLSQHTGGFVITRTRLDEVVPIAPAAMEDRTTIEWDKDDLDALGILKIDVLALGMLSCLRRGLDLLDAHYGERLSLATIPFEEPCVYDMICRADTIGVFQIESRAQMSMLPRLRPRRFYDLVIEVAIVRPGPIQGDMVHPYLRRRQGFEAATYPSKELEAVLGKTLGVPLFQEQAMKIAIVAAGFTPSEADKLRRAMATFKRVGTIHTFRAKMIEGMASRGYDRGFAERCFAQIEGFGTYGFPESHAASFALLVYASCWLKCRYPDVFACALLNSQPMGFYAPSQILRDAREHGVEAREADVNHSDWDCTLEPPDPALQRRIKARHVEQAPHILGAHALRLGFRMIKGVREADMRLVVERRGGGYDSVRDLWLRTGLSPAVLEHLATADAFRSIGLDRREALWAVRGLNRAGDKDDLALWRHAQSQELEPDAHLPPMPLGEHVVEDYRHLSLSLKAHPVGFLRRRLDARRMLRCADLAHARSTRVTVAGLVLVRQRPGSAKGVVFMTLEDETGVANAIIWPKVFEAQRAVVIGARFVAITGRLQNEAGVIHVVAEKLEDLSPMLGLLSTQGETVSALARADEVRRPQTRDPREPVGAMPKGRNFH